MLGAEDELLVVDSSALAGDDADMGGGGGASFLGGILSFMASRPLASANEVILWLGEKPAIAENFKLVKVKT